ncbi:Chloroperoxidase [Aspergillus transmontanensis]|uniref:Chloroperoxidase n=1 Tax=Aspergillus transmontanensis TaxID=1034304 RepID=A0A5N6VEP3_9EURO|nr:Chloroperoxidase [Aspergillus transmontanensis]
MKYYLFASAALFVAGTSSFRLPTEGQLSNRRQASIPAGHPPVHWKPAGPGDVRAPCPMLNTLANHGYLPHDGKNITEEHTIRALKVALNIEEELSQYLFQEALTTNPAENATTFSLNDLSRHNILEHDASLSRLDHYFGDNHDFNQKIFDQTRSYWPDPVISVQAAANAREARVKASNATNPTFALSELGLAFGYGETAAYIIILGNKTTGLVNRSWVEYLFENERLPSELGWVKREDPISLSDLENMLQQVVNATGNSEETKLDMIKRGDFHIGRRS